MRAHANAASVPAWPPPTTTTSNSCVKRIKVSVCIPRYRRANGWRLAAYCFIIKQYGAINSHNSISNYSLTDAERGKDAPQKLVRGFHPNDIAQCKLRAPQFLGH